MADRIIFYEPEPKRLVHIDEIKNTDHVGIVDTDGKKFYSALIGPTAFKLLSAVGNSCVCNSCKTHHVAISQKHLLKHFYTMGIVADALIFEHRSELHVWLSKDD